MKPIAAGDDAGSKSRACRNVSSLTMVLKKSLVLIGES
jgi:hypothetical protein